MLDLFVDIDACPVSIFPHIARVALRRSLDLYVVTKDYLGVDPNTHLILTEEGSEGGREWIAANITRGDICVTGEANLAAGCALRGALALEPNGRLWSPDAFRAAIVGSLPGAPETVATVVGALSVDVIEFAQRLDAAIMTARASRVRARFSSHPFTRAKHGSVFSSSQAAWESSIALSKSTLMV